MTDLKSDSLPTRDSLLSRIKDPDDEASWRDFFETYLKLIYNFARKAGLTDSEAQEVVQETVIGVSRKIGGFRTGAQHGSFKAWLLQQTRWRVADQFRKRDRFARNAEVGFGGCPPGLKGTDEGTRTATVNRVPDPTVSELGRIWDAEWREHLLSLALARLKSLASPKQLQMFDLHVLQGLSVRDTSHTTGASRAAVYMAVSRVRRLLRREIARLEKGSERIYRAQ